MKSFFKKAATSTAVLAVSFVIITPQASAEGYGCGPIRYHNNEASVDCWNNSGRSAIATLNVDCQPWSPDVKATAKIQPYGKRTLVARCGAWGKAVGGSASVS